MIRRVDLGTFALAALILGGCQGNGATETTDGGHGTMADIPGADGFPWVEPCVGPHCNTCNVLDDPACWACTTDSKGEHCLQRQPDTPNGQMGWICWDDATGFTHCVLPDDAQISAQWTCHDNGMLVECTNPQPDRPNHSQEWNCQEDLSEGLLCISPNQGLAELDDHWACHTDPALGLVCANPTPDTPDGAGGWICSQDATGRHCTKASSDDPINNPEWKCIEEANEGIHCTRTSRDTPYSSGSWNCWYDDAGARRCDREADPSQNPWECDDDPSGLVCRKVQTDTPSNEPWWTCQDDPTEGITCLWQGPGTPDNTGEWTCSLTTEGHTSCTTAGTWSDHTDIQLGWVCTESPGEGLTCLYQAPDDPDPHGQWECIMNGWGDTICYGGFRDHFEAGLGWYCLEDPAEGIICLWYNPDTPDASGDWTCRQEGLEIICASPSSDHSNIAMGWICRDDPTEGLVCSFDRTGGFGTPDSLAWDCALVADDIVCQSAHTTLTDHQDIVPGWICREDPTEGVICTLNAGGSGLPGTPDNWMASDTPNPTGQWTCADQADGSRVCTEATSDQQEVLLGWLCEDDPSEGRVCTLPPGGWDCQFAPDASIVCTSPQTTIATDHPSLSPNWICRDDPHEGVICTWRPQDHHTSSQGTTSTIGWVCQDDPMEGVLCRTQSTDTPDNSGIWTCVESAQSIRCTTHQGDTMTDHQSLGMQWQCEDDPAEGVVCQNLAPDYPDGMESSPNTDIWDCHYGPDGVRVCEQNPGVPYEPSCPTGTIEGRICSPMAGVEIEWLTDALVYIDAPAYCDVAMRRIAARTNELGQFTLQGVPPGTYTVHAEKGSFAAHVSNIVVRPNEVAHAPESLDSCLYLEAARIAVITGEYDSIENVLARVGLSADIYWGGYAHCEAHSPDPLCSNEQAIDLLTHLDQDPSRPSSASYMRNYDIIFFDCGTNMAGMDDDPVTQGIIANNIRQYVNEGHSIYVSDWDWLFVEWAFPERIDFWGSNDLVADVDQNEHVDNVLVGERSILGPNSPHGLTPASITDSTLELFMGKTDVEIVFDQDHWSVMDRVSPSVEVHITGDVLTVYDEVISGSPLLVSFQAGEGTVVFTAFHNITAPSQDMDDILNFLIFEL